MGKYCIIFISILSVFIFLSCGTESTPTYTLSTSVVGEGSITPAEGTYEEGEVVTLTSTPSEHWVFNSWSGDGSGTSTSITITMDSDKNVVGNFSERMYPLNITVVGEGTVTEEVIQSKSEHTFGTVVQLTPVPENGWKFVEWSGDLSGDVNPIQITITGEKNVTVTFERIDYPLTITIEGEGEVEQEIVQAKTTDYPFETVVQLTPKPSDGWRFVEWGGDLSGNEKPIQITISGEKNVTVKFEPIVYLGENGITIMCPNGNVGDIGIVDGVEYEVVDRQLLIQRWAEGKGKFERGICVSLITDMSFLYENTSFNEPIGSWDVSNVTNMRRMLYNTPFNQPIGDWDVSSVTDMHWMFNLSQFNQPIGNWNVSNVKDMARMFSFTPFNHPIGNWNVSNVTNMNGMFYRSKFNEPIGSWDVSNVVNMGGMFGGLRAGIGSSIIQPFNQPIGNWDVSNVTNMGGMFKDSKFNNSIGEWNVSKVTDMSQMFWESQFNQPIENWNTENVTDMSGMFSRSPFNQNISRWCVWRIGAEPVGFFELWAPNLQENFKPKWGTCPD